MKSNARRGAPEWCSSPYASRKILALLKRRGSWSSERVERRRCVCEHGFWRFEDCKCSERWREAGREFQFLEIIGTNVLANEVVRHFSNLTAKECWESAKRVPSAKHALGGELLTLTHRSTCRGSIYSKGKVQKHYDWLVFYISIWKWVHYHIV